MEKLLTSDRTRRLFLNGTLFALFATVWAADRWPQYGLLALALGFLVVICAALLLYRTAARIRSSLKAPRFQPAESRRGPAPLLDVAISSPPRDVPDLRDREFPIVQEQLPLAVYLRSLRASRASPWAIARSNEQRLHRFAPELEFRRPQNLELAKRRVLEAAKWQVVPQGEGAFSIIAGAFEIEHFYGRTNIRVIDPLRVTIEGELRGSRTKVAPAEFCAPTWN